METSGLQSLYDPSAGPWVQALENRQEKSAEQERRARDRLHLDGGGQPQRRAQAPRGAGRGWHGSLIAAPLLVLPVGWAAWSGQRLRAPAAASAAQATITQLPPPRQPGEAERLVAAAVKAKGFSFFPGIAGKCSLPMADSPASGAAQGSAVPSAEEESTLQDPGGKGVSPPSSLSPCSGNLTACLLS